MGSVNKIEGAGMLEANNKSLEAITSYVKKKKLQEERGSRKLTSQELVARSNSRMKVVRHRDVKTVYEGSAGVYCIPVSA